MEEGKARGWDLERSKVRELIRGQIMWYVIGRGKDL